MLLAQILYVAYTKRDPISNQQGAKQMTVPAAELKRSCDAEAMQSHMEAFVKDGIYDSAQLLGDLLLSLAAAPQDPSDATAPGAFGSREFHAKSYALFADLMLAKREYKRAIVSGLP